MNHFRISLICMMAGLALQASAATNFQYIKTIPAAASSAQAGRFTNMCGDSIGGLYITSSSTDGFAYMPDPVNDSYTSVAASTQGNFSSGNSFYGVTVAPNNSAIAGGKAPSADPSNSVYIKTSVPPPPLTDTLLSVAGLKMGPAAVSNTSFAVSDFADGSLTFLDNPSGTTVNVLNPTAITGGAANARSLVFDSVGQKIYQAASSPTTISGLVHVFNSNGTPAGTTAGSVYKPGVATTLGASEQGISYQGLAVSTVARLLAVAQNPGSSPAGATGWAIYNLTTGNQIDFINLGPTDVPSGTALTGAAATASQQAQGCAFIEKGGSTYLALGAGSGTTAGSATISRVYLFKKVNANVSDWSIY